MQVPFLPGVSAEVLANLAAKLRTGTLSWPKVTAISLKANISSGGSGLLEELKALAAQFPTTEQAAAVLSMLAVERGTAEAAAKRRLELVWSGPEGKSQSRDTAITIGELFARAERKVLMSTFNVGWKKELFGPLVEKVQRDPKFELKMFVHIDRELTNHYIKAGEDPAAAFRRWFIATHWSDARLPEVYYDPRATDEGNPGRKGKYPPKLHAKCVIVDDEIALVTSANFTDAAQNDNIEAGVLVQDGRFARALAHQFEGLVATKGLVRVI